MKNIGPEMGRFPKAERMEETKTDRRRREVRTNDKETATS
jgi:hypothetical protein